MNKDYIELLQDENTGEFYEPYATIACKTEEDLKNMQEALEKQIPKKPYIWGDGYYNGELILDMYDCPNCEKSYEIECDDYKYCPNCGQKIDWSKVDENRKNN